MKKQWQVIVGNVGTVYAGNNGAHAYVEYNQYKSVVNRDYGRAAGESVTIMCDDHIHDEYEPNR